MQLWQDGLVALLASIGLASIMWTAVRAVLYAGQPRRQGVVALLPAAGGGEGLEEQVKTLRALRGEQELFGMVLLVDCGLTEEGRKLAKLLARQDRWVSLCRQDEVADYLAG